MEGVANKNCLKKLKDLYKSSTKSKTQLKILNRLR